MENIGIYVHVPFCVRKCPYCDFYSEDHWDNAKKTKLVQAICREIDIVCGYYRMQEKRKLISIYFGGGTPSLLEPEEFTEILRHIDAAFKITTRTEVTMECNPATADAQRLQAYKKSGLNRLSIGVQSFDRDVLRTLGRIHTPEEAVTCVEKARRAGIRNISLDLMFGIPGQSYTSWMHSVEKAISLGVKHLSLYSLEFMDGTPFAYAREAGYMQETAPELDRLMYESALRMLAEAGLYQYEISNVSKPRHQCRHNLAYWDLRQYLGFGPSAHSFIEHVRFANCSDTDAYIAAIARDTAGTGKFLGSTNALGSLAVDTFTKNAYRDNVVEYVFTGLRKNEGIRYRTFEERFGKEFWDIYGGVYEAFMEYVKIGCAEEDGEGLRLTLRGMSVSNRIMALFV